jgi:hypothetical protein
MRIGTELLAVRVDPPLLGLISEMLPDRLRAPVVILLRHEIAPLDDEDARRAVGQRVSHRAASGAAADDDDVVTFRPHQAVR